jgi:hypothetical protein
LESLLFSEFFITRYYPGLTDGHPGLLKKILVRFVTPDTSVATITREGNTRCVVDFSSWHHQLLYRVSTLVIEGTRDQAIAVSLPWVNERLQMLRRSGVTHVHLVRDGCPLPAKAGTDAKRAHKREAVMAQLRQLQLEGGGNSAAYKKARDQAVRREGKGTIDCVHPTVFQSD